MNKEDLKKLLLQTYYKGKDGLGYSDTELEADVAAILSTIHQAIEAELPNSFKQKAGLDVALLWDSQDATDGYNQALQDIKATLNRLLGDPNLEGNLDQWPVNTYTTGTFTLQAKQEEKKCCLRANLCHHWIKDEDGVAHNVLSGRLLGEKRNGGKDQ